MHRSMTFRHRRYSELEPTRIYVARLLVVGAGLAGMAAALESCRLGHDVAIVEASPILGGRGTSIELDEWVLEPGPHFLRGKGEIQNWLKKSSKVSIANRRIDPRRMQIIRNGIMRPLPLTTNSLNGYDLNAVEKRRMRTLARFLNSELKKNPNQLIEEWLKDKSKAIKDTIECLTIITSWMTIEHNSSLSFHLPEIINTLRGKSLYLPLGGWAEVTGRFLAAMDSLEVQTKSSTAVTKLIFDKKGGIRGAKLSGNVKVEADGIILCTPIKPTAEILSSSRIDIDLPEISELKVGIWDLLLDQELFRDTHAIWDSDRKIVAVINSSIVPERMPEQFRKTHSHLQIITYSDLGVVEGFLDERCLGWRSHLISERKLENVVISQMSEVFEERPGCYFEQPMLDNGLAFAGEWMSNEEWLSEGAFNSGLKAARELHHSLQTSDLE